MKRGRVTTSISACSHSEKAVGTPQEGGLSTGREVPSEPNPADTLSLGVQPPEPWEKQVSIVSVTQSVVFV